jgi:hypothetical protein
MDVSRKKWRRDGVELITFFIVQPCDGARRYPDKSDTLRARGDVSSTPLQF